MSGNRDTPHMKSKNRTKRTAPSMRLKTIWPPKAGLYLLSSVAANSGRYLYMKMKNASETMTFPAASHPLIDAAFSRVCDGEDSTSLRLGGTVEACVDSFCITSSIATFAEKRKARYPSDMAYPSVITPRTIDQAIHLCFSDGRSSGSLKVTTSPEGLRQAIAQACGERIITPSSTACPPTRVSSPLSSAGKSCTATRKRTKFRRECTVIRCSRRAKAPTTRLSHGYPRSYAG